MKDGNAMMKDILDFYVNSELGKAHLRAFPPMLYSDGAWFYSESHLCPGTTSSTRKLIDKVRSGRSLFPGSARRLIDRIRAERRVVSVGSDFGRTLDYSVNGPTFQVSSTYGPQAWQDNCPCGSAFCGQTTTYRPPII